MLYKKLAEACIDGDLVLFISLLELYKVDTAELKKILEQDNYKLFHLAIASGNVPLLDKVSVLICETSNHGWPYDEILNIAFDARKGEGFRETLIAKKTAMVASLLEDEFLHSSCLDIIDERSEFIAYILSEPGLADIVSYSIRNMFNGACATGLDAVLRLENILPLELIKKFLLPKQNAENPYSTISSFEYVKESILIEHLWQLMDEREKKLIVQQIFPRSLILCAKEGNEKVISAILGLLTERQIKECLQFEDYNTFVYAADRGHVHIMKLVWQHLDKQDKSQALKASNYAAYRLAKQSNRLEAIAFLQNLNV